VENETALLFSRSWRSLKFCSRVIPIPLGFAPHQPSTVAVPIPLYAPLIQLPGLFHAIKLSTPIESSIFRNEVNKAYELGLAE
jgi:hypothetical protein